MICGASLIRQPMFNCSGAGHDTTVANPEAIPCTSQTGPDSRGIRQLPANVGEPLGSIIARLCPARNLTADLLNLIDQEEQALPAPREPSSCPHPASKATWTLDISVAEMTSQPCRKCTELPHIQTAEPDK